MARWRDSLWRWGGGLYLLTVLVAGCSSVDFCGCDREARKENPDRETMAECETLYQGLTYEEVEAELEKCAAQSN